MPRAIYRHEDREFIEEYFFYADSALFDIFTYKVLSGDARSALLAQNKIVLTETVAARYFGEDDPLGKTLTTGDATCEVTGVIEDVPSNSHFRSEPQSIQVRNFMHNRVNFLILRTKFMLAVRTEAPVIHVVDKGGKVQAVA
jgi:putative ABC transport system permease protein